MFEILQARKINKGSLQFTIDLCVQKWGDFAIYGVQIWAKDGKRWISFPSKKIEVAGSETRYLPYCRFKDRARQDAFAAKVIESFEYWLSQGNKPQEFEAKETVTQHATPAYGAGSNNTYQDEGIPF